MKTISIKLLLLISILFIALGCEKDDAIGEGENSSEIQEVLSKTLNLEDIPNYDKVNKSIQKLDKNLNSGANSLFKNLDNDEVQILTDDIIYMTYAETHTYTFKLLRNNPQYYIENIVLHYNVKTFSYDEYLVQYDVNDQEFIQINQGSSLGDDVDVLITELKGGTLNSFLGKSSCFRVCETVNVNCSAGGDHSYGQTCNGTADQQPYQYQSCGSVCIETNPNPPETIDDGGNTGGGGSTPGDDNVLTNPNPNEPCETSNGSTGITGDDGCITTVDEIERGNLLISIGDRLSISERNWVNNQAPLYKITQINQFIDELSWRDRNEGKDFAVEVVKVSIENPEVEVDFENEYNLNLIQFESIQEFLENIDSESLASSTLIDLQDNIVNSIAEFTINRSPLTPCKLDVIISSNYNSHEDCYDFDNVNTSLSGFTTPYNFEQSSEVNSVIDGDYIFISLSGTLTTGLNIQGYGLFYSETIIIEIRINRFNGEFDTAKIIR
ncbi:hypothetical protein LB452_00385 [Psychroflexus sp. CAK8W]|uniref:DUF5689 domain-containing protein n=1 Tax=Psychroflexus longus TaxID=2873596 RepID=A0ABS7XEJ8_9FLAO|nr:hypothetical protein [Psychroflexus longus]MBZ9777365.1 hypothetical protein [Psychroflexus longus]